MFVRSGLHEDPAVTTLLIGSRGRYQSQKFRRQQYDTTHRTLDIHGLDVLELLVERGADIHAKNDFGDYSATPWQHSIGKILVSWSYCWIMGADINVQSP